MLRKLFHITGSIIPIVYFLTDKQTALIVTAGLFVVDIVLETLRIKGFMNVAFIENNMKKEESSRLSGSFFYILSGLITIICFAKNIAVSSLFILSIADPLSSTHWEQIRQGPFPRKISGGDDDLFCRRIFNITGIFFLYPHCRRWRCHRLPDGTFFFPVYR